MNIINAYRQCESVSSYIIENKCKNTNQNKDISCRKPKEKQPTDQIQPINP